MSRNLVYRGGYGASDVVNAKVPLEGHVSKLCLDADATGGYKDIPWHMVWWAK
jgi:hypothetical protein